MVEEKEKKPNESQVFICGQLTHIETSPIGAVISIEIPEEEAHLLRLGNVRIYNVIE